MTTSFRINAEKLSMKTTKETLGIEKLLEIMMYILQFSTNIIVNILSFFSL